jgi:phage recombination protein Bet
MTKELAKTAGVGLVTRIAEKYGVDPDKMLSTLKATAFKQENNGDISNEQMMSLLIVAEQYGLNPFTRELYAFPNKGGGIVPVVSIDGWARLVNTHRQFDGMRFTFDAEGCTCIMFRRDRAHPIEVTEFFAECKRNTGPWQSHPRRMLRHKAYIQCARLAFGFAGIYDEDEAFRIIEKDITPEVNRIDDVRSRLNSVLDPTAPATATAYAAAKDGDDGEESFTLTPTPVETPGLVESGVGHE